MNSFLRFFGFTFLNSTFGFKTFGTLTLLSLSLQHVVRTVANVDLSERVTDLLFTMFDEDENGLLKLKEFVVVMRDRNTRGLQRPKDTGFTRLVRALGLCSKDLVLSALVESGIEQVKQESQERNSTHQ